MFKIIKEPFGGLQKYKLINSKTGEFLSVIPQFGANIYELSLLKNNTLYTIISGEKSYQEYIKTAGVKYKGAWVLPFANRIAHGKYNYAGNTYNLEKNENGINALHGFVWNKPFEVIQKKAENNFAELKLLYQYNGAISGYPFPFDAELLYLLSDKFNCILKVTNRSSHPIPYSAASHLYFYTGSKIDSLKIKLPNGNMINTDKYLIPDGNISIRNDLANGKILGNEFIDNAFGPVNNIPNAEVEVYDPQKDITITIVQSAGNNGYNYVQLYTPPDRKSIAIEPMTSAPDAFNNKKGLIEIQPNKSIELSYTITLS